MSRTFWFLNCATTNCKVDYMGDIYSKMCAYMIMWKVRDSQPLKGMDDCINKLQKKYINRFIINDLSIWLWRLGRWKSADFMSQLKSEEWQAAIEPGIIDVSVWRPWGRRIHSSLGKSLTFALGKTSADWIRLTHVRESNLLYSLYQFKC